MSMATKMVMVKEGNSTRNKADHGKKKRLNVASGRSNFSTKSKHKWASDQTPFHGSLQEGLGFAFRRKEKVKQKFNRYRKQERFAKQELDTHDKFPGHLRHLYEAEEQRQRITKLKSGKPSAPTKHSDRTSSNVSPSKTADKEVHSEQGDATPPSPQKESLKRKRKGSALMRIKEDFEKQQEERSRRNEAFQKYQMERDEAIRKYNEKKKANYEMFRKKTKRRQPNLNAQMELLLQKIEAKRK